MRIVIKTTDGVAIMSLVEGADEAEALDKWKAVNPGEYVSHREMPDAAIPKDRSYRDAWADTTPDPVIDIDMTKAREVHKDKLREARKPRLEGLDVDYLLADEAGNASQKAAIATQKQALRDITDHPDIAAAQTIDDLKAADIDTLLAA